MQDTWTPTAVPSDLEQARRARISLIKARRKKDRYAALLSRALTTEAKTLVRSVFGSFHYWQRKGCVAGAGPAARPPQARNGLVAVVALDGMRFSQAFLRVNAIDQGEPTWIVA
jgi:hypothetical protein